MQTVIQLIQFVVPTLIILDVHILTNAVADESHENDQQVRNGVGAKLKKYIEENDFQRIITQQMQEILVNVDVFSLK